MTRSIKKIKKVTDCTSYEEFLNFLKEILKCARLEDIAPKLGYKSKASLSMFLSNKRVVTRKGLSALSFHFGWSALEASHIESLILQSLNHQNSRKLTETGKFQIGFKKRFLVEKNQFSYLKSWNRLPLLMFLAAKKSIPNLEYLEKKFRYKVSSHELLFSLQAFETLGFIKRFGRKIEFKVEPYIEFYASAPSLDIRSFHGQMLDRASESIQEQSLDERCLRSLTLSMDPTRMNEAASYIAEFYESFSQRFSNSEKLDVAQLSIQLFWHTDPKI